MPKLYFYVLGALALIAATIALAAPSLSKGSQWVEQAKWVSDNSAGEYEFAQAVAIDGDTAVVGLPYYGTPTDLNNAGRISAEVSRSGATGKVMGWTNEGAAYVYRCSGSRCSLSAKLLMPKNQADGYHEFGSEVAIDGDTILVAADAFRGEALNEVLQYLPLYIFTRSRDSWSLQQSHLALPYSLKATYSIKSVALSGDTAVVGIGGRTHVFHRHPSTGSWSYEAELTPDTPTYGFGEAVAIDGDTIIVSGGTPSKTITSNSTVAAFVFVRNSTTGSWSLQAQLVPFKNENTSTRRTVALSSNTAVVGLPGESSDRGAAFVYERNPATGKWSKQARLVPNDVLPFHQYGFGGSVGIDGNSIVVGVSLEHKASPNWFQPHRVEKAVYVFERNSRIGWWSQPVKLLPQDYKEVARTYGKRVDISGERVILSAGSIGTDSAYIFRRVN
ncbi:FG-GAP repeat protein [Chroococcidiopsis thermalis]|nr:FG-GAP repeat protein [Chroococcidiopsis thermalis]